MSGQAILRAGMRSVTPAAPVAWTSGHALGSRAPSSASPLISAHSPLFRQSSLWDSDEQEEELDHVVFGVPSAAETEEVVSELREAWQLRCPAPAGNLSSFTEGRGDLFSNHRVQRVVTSLIRDPCVWDAVFQNPEVQDLRRWLRESSEEGEDRLADENWTPAAFRDGESDSGGASESHCDTNEESDRLSDSDGGSGFFAFLRSFWRSRYSACVDLIYKYVEQLFGAKEGGEQMHSTFVDRNFEAQEGEAERDTTILFCFQLAVIIIFCIIAKRLPSGALRYAFYQSYRSFVP